MKTSSSMQKCSDKRRAFEFPCNAHQSNNVAMNMVGGGRLPLKTSKSRGGMTDRRQHGSSEARGRTTARKPTKKKNRFKLKLKCYLCGEVQSALTLFKHIKDECKLKKRKGGSKENKESKDDDQDKDGWDGRDGTTKNEERESDRKDGSGGNQGEEEREEQEQKKDGREGGDKPSDEEGKKAKEQKTGKNGEESGGEEDKAGKPNDRKEQDGDDNNDDGDGDDDDN